MFIFLQIDLQRRGFPAVRLMNCAIKLCLKALAGEGGFEGFLSPQKELSISICKSTKLRLEEDDSDLLPTRGYKHMLKHSAMGSSTTFAKLGPKISGFTDSVITSEHLQIAQCVIHTTNTLLLTPP